MSVDERASMREVVWHGKHVMMISFRDRHWLLANQLYDLLELEATTTLKTFQNRVSSGSLLVARYTIDFDHPLLQKLKQLGKVEARTRNLTCVTLSGAKREDGCIYINFRYCNPSWQLHLNNNRPQVLLGWDMHGAKVHEYVPRLVAWLSQGLPPEFDHQCASHVVHHTCQHPACCNFEHLQWMALADHAQQHAGKKRKTGHR